jgi:HK97 family phage prohead protease
MQVDNVFSAPAELKFIDGEEPGTFAGFGSVYGNEDSHSDVVLQGAFAASLAGYANTKSLPRMFVEHSHWKGGDPLPVGIWQSVTEEPGGLRVKGRLIGIDHPDVKRVSDLMHAGELKGLSIAFPTPASNTVIYGRRPGEPRRTLKQLHVVSIDIVGDPSNPLARIDTMKSLLVQADQQAACDALGAAMDLHRTSMSGGNSPNMEQRAAMMGHLQAAHMALTGSPVPRGMKSAPTLREAEAAIGMMFGLSNAQVRDITDHGLKSWLSRDENRELVEQTELDRLAALDTETRSSLKATLAEFSLPEF